MADHHEDAWDPFTAERSGGAQCTQRGRAAPRLPPQRVPQGLHRLARLDDEYALTMAVKAVNGTAGPSGTVPSWLLFGVVPRLPIHPLPLPNNTDRMMALRLAGDEMARITARARIETALSRNTPGAADAIIRMGETVLWYRDKPIERWTGSARSW